MVLVIGENIKVRRFARYADGISVPYVHAGGKIGVLVNLESDLPAEKVEEIGKGRGHADRRSEPPLLGTSPRWARTSWTRRRRS